jgi:hypothetical protein
MKTNFPWQTTKYKTPNTNKIEGKCDEGHTD